jgi:enoyl-CoA hydratase/carnithine racemase
MGRELRDIFVPLRFAPGDLRCIVITGVGDKAFSAGGDLKERHGMSDDDWRLQHALFEEGYYAVMDCPVPVIAAVNGHAYAGGCELALACDFIYAARHARFALTEVSIGIMPGGGGTQNLPRAIGERRAKELILTARPFSAEEAFAWGMVNRVCDGAELMREVMAVAERICDNAPISVRQAKKSIHYGMQVDLGTGLVFEVQAYERMITTEDRREGIRSFNEKRKARFAGR